MNFLVDLIVVIIILLFSFLGYKRGLIKVAIKLCTFFIAIVVAFMLYKPVSNIVIEKTSIDENIESAIITKILPEGGSSDSKVDISNNLPDIILKNSENTISSISKSFSSTLIGIGCFLVIFIVVKLLLKLITLLTDLIAKLPILKQFNELGGLIYGIIEGLFIVFVGFAVISLLSPLLDASILSSINSSMLGSMFYNNNILLKFIMS